MVTITNHMPTAELQALDAAHHLHPFTDHQDLGQQGARIIERAEGVYIFDVDGNRILDGMAGLWCVNAGHGRAEISEAVSHQIREMEYAPLFQMGHPRVFEFAEQLVGVAPEGLKKVFFTNSGSESVDTALKIALAYHRVRGEGGRQRLIGREKGYHGVGFGGISVGGMVNNRKFFGAMLPGVDHLPHTFDLEHNAFSKGLPQWGAHLADELERLEEIKYYRNFQAGQTIIWSGDRMDFVGSVVSGIATLMMVLQAGQRTFLPAASSGASNNSPHFGLVHITKMDMSVS